MKMIKVPRVTAKAFDKHRRASDLLRRQVAQLEHVVEVRKGAGAIAMSAKRVRTEAQAARFIAEAAQALNLVTRVPEPSAAETGAAGPAPTPPAKRRVKTRTPTRARGGGRRAPAKPGASKTSKRMSTPRRGTAKKRMSTRKARKNTKTSARARKTSRRRSSKAKP